MNPLLLSFVEVCQMVVFVAVVVAMIEAWLYLHFTYSQKKWFVPLMAVSAPVWLCALVFLSIGTDIFSMKLGGPVIVSLLAGLAAALLFKYRCNRKYALAYMLIAPGFIGLALLIAYPLFFEIYLAFHDLKLTTLKTWSDTGFIPWIGLKHFYNVFTKSPLSEVTFWALLGRTLWWTFINVFFHVLGGFALALLLNNKISCKGIYRTLIVIPWAMPQVVAVLAMRGEFHSQYGFINLMLMRMGLEPVQWLSQHPFLTCTIINVWLGIPFMMVVILGGLQAIPQSYYDAASIDGATRWQKFRNITMPLVKPVLAPAVTLGTVWTFNNINVIYLVTGQSGGTEQADILVSALYKAAFTFNRYSYSAAFAIVIFVILFVLSMLWLKFSKGTESVYD